MKKLRALLMTIIGFLSLYGVVSLNAKTISTEQITDKHIEEYKSGKTIYSLDIFVINFANIIYNVNGKNIKIPIFKGTMGDVHYNDLLNYYRNKTFFDSDVNSETGYIIKVKKGEAKKTLHEFLAFYKSNILKDIDIEHPVTIYLSPVEWILQYNFVVDGVPCYMHINFESRKEDYGKPLPKSVYDIVPNENAGNPGIFFMFYRGRSVPQ